MCESSWQNLYIYIVKTHQRLCTTHQATHTTGYDCLKGVLFIPTRKKMKHFSLVNHIMLRVSEAATKAKEAINIEMLNTD